MGEAGVLPSLLKSIADAWRGLTTFFYVAAHWSSISRDLEDHRRQSDELARVTKEWARIQLETQEALHRRERLRWEQELALWQQRAEACSTRNKTHDSSGPQNPTMSAG
jgi:hypothetical protein